MTVKELFEKVLSLMFCPADEGGEYEEIFLNILNLRLLELCEVNKWLREYKGKEELRLKMMRKLSDELEVEDEIIAALPYGIAGILLTEEDTTGMANVYRSEYDRMISACGRAFEEE